MSEFRVGRKEYKLSQTAAPTERFTQDITELANELEAARKEGRFSRLATEASSKLPKEAYKYVEDYIKEQQRKLYGGAAINMYLPRNHKIYKAGALPDYDFFSPEPWKDAVALADTLFEAGFKYTETKAGLHQGTFKVFADFWPVADITYLPPDLYDQIPTRRHNGFTIVSPEFLQMTLYDLISKPIEAPVRWPNVAFRQKLLERWSPAKFRKKQCAADFITDTDLPDIDPKLQTALDIVYREARLAKLIHGGSLAYNKYISIAKGHLRVPVYYYQLYAQDSQRYATRIQSEIQREMPAAKLKTDVFYQPHKDMNNTSYVLYMIVKDQRVPVFIITELTRCIPYKFIGGRYYCAIDYIFYELYAQMFNEDTDIHSRDVSCLIRYLHYIQERYYKKNGITELDKSPFQRFVTKCRGPFVDTVREAYHSRWIDRAKAQANLVDILPMSDSVTITGVKGKKIRVFPKNLIVPQECAGRSRTDCSYPCSWVKEIGKCGGIPFGGYQPGNTTPTKIATNDIVNLKGAALL